MRLCQSLSQNSTASMRNRPLLSFLFLIATKIESGTAVTNNADGTGGTPPSIYQYVMLNADETSQYTAMDPHAVHAGVTQNNGYVLVGSALTSESNGKCLALNYSLLKILCVLFI